MEQILSLSQNEKNFTQPPPVELSNYVEFKFKQFVPQALKLLSLDPHLAHIHAKISPKMEEELFWKNYYTRMMYLRARIGIDGPSIQGTLGSFSIEDVIYRDESSRKDNSADLSNDIESTVLFLPTNLELKGHATSSPVQSNSTTFKSGREWNPNENPTDTSSGSLVDLSRPGATVGYLSENNKDSEELGDCRDLRHTLRDLDAEEAALAAEVSSSNICIINS
jgi:hypothetical protein